MARTKKQEPTVDARDVELALLREQVARLSVANAAHVTQLSTMDQHTPFSNTAYVGIRNVSDNTIGIKGEFGQPDLQLFADLGTPEPGSVAAIPYAWWLRMRTGHHVRNGMIIRDDSILGKGFTPAPPDRPEELPEGWEHNYIPDPEAWIRSRNEMQIRADMAKVTSDHALRRIRRGVDIVLKRLQDSYGPETENKAARAVQELPVLFQLVDQLTTHRLERPEDFAR